MAAKPEEAQRSWTAKDAERPVDFTRPQHYDTAMYPSPLAIWILHWIVSGVALLITSFLVPGFRVKDFGSALVAALVIGLANVFIRPVLLFLTLPLNILTLGLFTFVVNAVILKMVAALLDGFKIASWTSAIIGAFILAVVGMLLHFVVV